MELGGLDPKTSQEMKLFARARAELEPEILDFGRARAEPEPQNLNFARAEPSQSRKKFILRELKPSQSRVSQLVFSRDIRVQFLWSFSSRVFRECYFSSIVIFTWAFSGE